LEGCAISLVLNALNVHRNSAEGNMADKYERLKTLVGEIHDVHSTLAILDWDQQTNMPEGGSVERSAQIETLSKFAHEKATSDELGELLEELKQTQAQRYPDSDEFCLIKVMEREYERKIRVPAELVSEFAGVTARAQHEWEKALEASDFSLFRPHLEKIFELRKAYSACFAPYDHIYDPLLDEFEPGLKTADVIAMFDKIRPVQAGLVKELGERPQVDSSFLYLDYDPGKQWDFGVEVISAFGYDWKRGRQDKAVHPFTTTFGLGDVRITTRIFNNNLSSGLFSTIHEGGHALYEQGVARNLSRTPLGTGASLSIHESQSRMWENLVGRSRDFWVWAYPRLQKLFPSQLGGVDMEHFYRGVNRVEPSLVRVEADEATYNLHIMLRLELEIMVLEGRAEVKDLPELWREKMLDYLGVAPDNDKQGVLQDVHWSCGIMGYFPTYALGNIVSAQIWEKINQDIPELGSLMRSGQFQVLREWLREKLHCHGAKFEPQELIRRITGEQINPTPYLNYLKNKFTDIYGR
jgi:carboxypeptidase Taq